MIINSIDDPLIITIYIYGARVIKRKRVGTEVVIEEAKDGCNPILCFS